MGYTIGADLGSTLTKVVLVDEDGRIVKCDRIPSDTGKMTQKRNLEEKLTAWLGAEGISPEEIARITMTGAGADFVEGSVLGVLPEMKSEMDAQGAGGCALSGLDNCIVTSLGTGTTFVHARHSQFYGKEGDLEAFEDPFGLLDDDESGAHSAALMQGGLPQDLPDSFPAAAPESAAMDAAATMDAAAAPDDMDSLLAGLGLDASTMNVLKGMTETMPDFDTFLKQEEFEGGAPVATENEEEELTLQSSYICFHLGESGVGGGTVMGMAEGLCPAIKALKTSGASQNEIMAAIKQLAGQGSAAKVDLNRADITRADVTRSDISTQSQMATASNLARISPGSSEADLLAGIINMVCQSASTMSIFLARGEGVREIVVTGTGTELPFVEQLFQAVGGLYGYEFTFVENASYATALGTTLV